MTRVKTCEQSDYRDEDSITNYDDKCAGEEDEKKKKEVSEQTIACNIQACPGELLEKSISFKTVAII